MIKKFVFVVGLFFSLVMFSQDYSDQWKSYFSYNSIKDVVLGNNKLYAASENAVFSYNLATREIEKLTTVNGLSGEIISTIHYSEAYELLLIGFENGLIQISFDSNNDILTVVDILEKPTIPPNNKKINHFNENDGLVYISTEYGISVYDLDNLEFGDTYYIGSLGSQVRVRQTTIFADYIYAACQDGNGLRRALLNNPNLIDYQEWEQAGGGNYLSVQEFSGKLYAFKNNRQVFEVSLSNMSTLLTQYSNPPIDVKVFDGLLSVTTESNCYLYSPDFVLLATISFEDTPATAFTSSVSNQSNIYIGSTEVGVLSTDTNNPVEFEEIYPEGPLMNVPFSIQASNDELWVTFGDYNLTFNPYPLRSRGISHLVGEEWINTPFDSLLGARNLNRISLSPVDPSQVFISSFIDGLLEINNEEASEVYNQFNSPLESIENNGQPSDIRLSASEFDRQGVLWTLTGRVEHPLKSYNPETSQWQTFDFSNIISNYFEDDWGYRDMAIDQNGTKWLASYNFGVIGFNENNGSQSAKNIVSEEQNMPSIFVTSLAIDRRNQLWIGTYQGLRVLYNTSGFFEDPNPEVYEIIIEEDGLGSELLYQQFISDIEVDGSNNKWVGTFGTGLFYFSSNGQETIYHFTIDNSPLPSNNIVDVSLDTSKGIVYIATDKGLLSFYAGGSSTKDNLENAFVYPNPVRPGFNIVEDKIKIKDISDNVNIKITDIEGNLVAEAQSRTNLRYKGYNLEIDGGTAYWNGKNLANNIVASGVYLILLTDLDSLETNVLKIMVVR